MMEPMSEIAKSEFNMAMAWLNRINYYFYLANEHSFNLNAYEWWLALLVLFRELRTEMKDEERKEKKEEAEKIFNDMKTELFKQQRTGKKGITPELYWKLDSFESWLRDVLDRSGLQKKVMESAMAALR